MKRFVVLLMVLCLIPIYSFAHKYDVFTDRELLAVFDEIKMELMNRGLFGEGILITGQYIVGIDIPAGTYIFSLLQPATRSNYSICAVKEAEDSEDNLVRQMLYKGDKIRITLKEGNILTLEDVECATLEKADPVFGE